MDIRQTDPPCHQCAASDRRHTHVLTGDPDCDFAIEHNHNGNLPARLSVYLKHHHNAYGPRTGYGGYDGYSGDD